jgi:hypothetical protein
VIAMLADPLTERLATFVRGIGLAVHAATLLADTFLPLPSMLRWLR